MELAYNYALWKNIFTLKVLKVMPRDALKIQIAFWALMPTSTKNIGRKALTWRIIKENFSQIHPISKMGKIRNCHFLMINKFQRVTEHIEFFFVNFHIWYIATRGWSRLWLYHKIDNENTDNLVSFVNAIHYTYFIYF
jgi:hypothetical protein